MNQFKQAKQKLIAQGKNVENITDLKTAGVKATTEETPKPTETPKIKEESVEPAKRAVQEPVKSATDTVVEEIVKPVEEEPAKEIVQASTKPETPESKVSTNVPKAEPSVEKAPEKIPVAIPTQENVEPSITEPEPIIEPVKKVPVAEVVPTPVVVVQEPVQKEEIRQQETPVITQEPIYTAPQPQPVYYTPPVSQQATYIEAPVQSATTQKTQTNRKSIPNIFAPKEEPKSMRKSLVLKPTSVKKAESYCSKNGGSFNELIQTLLDNFISEYGL